MGGNVNKFVLFVILLCGGVAYADGIPVNAKVCVISTAFHLEKLHYSCDGGKALPLKRIHRANQGAEPEFISETSGQLVKFLALGYTLKLCNQDLDLCILTK